MQNNTSILIRKEETGMRINQCLALRGVATRKSIDAMVKSGAILINGKTAVLGQKLRFKDSVTFQATGKPSKALVYYAYNKPIGVVTSMPNRKEKTILDVAHFPEDVFPIGRIDKDSSGLMIMTNDGRVTDRLLNPKSVHEKEYSVAVNKPITHLFLTRLQSGIAIGRGEKTKRTKARRTDKYSFDIILTEGKNRQIRRMCAAFGYDVTSLVRIRIMNILLGTLKANQFRIIKGGELAEFLKSLGLE